MAVANRAQDSFVVDFTLTDEVRDAIAAFEAQLVAPIHKHTMLANGVADCCACCDDVRAGNECKCGELDALTAEAAQIEAAEMADR